MQKTIFKPHFPTATVYEHRLRLFQATRRPKLINQKIETQWGLVYVKGRLGQAHADVFEAICYEREAKADLEDGRIKILVDPYKVRKRSGCTSGTTFKNICVELQTAYIEIIAPIEKACCDHLIDYIDKARKKDGSIISRINPMTHADRALWRVEVGKAFCKLIKSDIWVGYDPFVLAQMSNGISQAVARHVLTHKNNPISGWTLNGLIQAVAGDISVSTMKDRRREIRGHAAQLRAAGVIVDGERLFAMIS